MREIRGKTVLITGVSSGIGRAITLRLADEGATLFLVDIDEKGLAETAAAAREAGGEVFTRRCNVAEAKGGSGGGGGGNSRWDGVDILVNNAGITYYGKVERMAGDHWDRLMRVNLLSHMQFTRELLPSLLARRQAHVLNVCSVL